MPNEEEFTSKWKDETIKPSEIDGMQYFGNNVLTLYLTNGESIDLENFATTKFFRITHSNKKDFEDDPVQACTDLMGKLKERQDTDVFVFRRLIAEDMIKTVVGKDYVSVEMEELETIVEEMLKTAEIKNWSKEKYETSYARGQDYVRYIIEDVTKPVPEVGDLMAVGLQIRNSELGTRGVSVSLFCKRLACSNGMCAYSTEKTFSTAHLGGKEGLLNEFSDTCDVLLDKAWEMLNWINRAASIKIPNKSMEDYLQMMVDQKVISGKIKAAIIEAISGEKYGKNEENMWALINGITGIASHEASAGVQDKLERMASDLLVIKKAEDFMALMPKQ